jgi:hypothetical protein
LTERVLTEEEYREWLLERVRALGRREDELERQLGEALDALEGVVEQDCTLCERLPHHGFRRANEKAFTVLEGAGRVRRVEGTRESYRFTTEEERRGQ